MDVPLVCSWAAHNLLQHGFTPDRHWKIKLPSSQFIYIHFRYICTRYLKTNFPSAQFIIPFRYICTRYLKTNFPSAQFIIPFRYICTRYLKTNFPSIYYSFQIIFAPDIKTHLLNLSFLSDIFAAISTQCQCHMLLKVADKISGTLEQCRLLLLAMRKFSNLVEEHGVSLHVKPFKPTDCFSSIQYSAI